MTFTTEETEILKLMIAETKAKVALTIARETDVKNNLPLQDNLKSVMIAIINKCK